MTEIADLAHQAVQTQRIAERRLERRSIAISIAVLIISVAISYYVPKEFKPELAFATITALLSYIITVQYARLSKFTAIDTAIEKIDQSMIKGYEKIDLSVINGFQNVHENFSEIKDADKLLLMHVKASHSFAEKVTRLIEFEPIIQSCGSYSLKTSIDNLSFKNINKFIKLTGNEISFSTYHHFWEKLLDFKKEFPSRKITAFITHASDIDAWDGRESKTLKEINVLHRQFVNESGFVFRIFIDCDQNQYRLQKYIEAMKHMRDAGLHCAYIAPIFSLALKENHIDRDISIIDTGHSVEFHIGVGRHVKAFTLGNNPDYYKRCMAEWIDYVHNVQEYDYSRHKNLSSADKKFLINSRNSFIEALNLEN